MKIAHPFTSAKADGTDATQVQPSNWNADHTLTLTGPAILGRSATGVGAAAEVTVGDGLTLAANTLSATALGVLSDSVSVAPRAATLNFTGATVTASGSDVTIAITPGGGGGAVATNLSLTASATGVTVVSDSGTDAAIPSASDTLAGVMPSAAKVKLDGIALNATANSTDANLRDRTTHTGFQAVSTVTGLQTALDGKATAGQGSKADTAVQPAGLTKAAVGLSNVDNTSDAAKPISTATQTALNGKTATGHSHVFSDIAGLTLGLSEKSNVGHGHVSVEISDIAQVLAEKDLYIQTLSMGTVSALNGTEQVAVIQSDVAKLTTVDGILARSGVMVATKVAGAWAGMAAPGGGVANDLIVISSAEPVNTDGRPDGTIYIKVA